jgi:hypothetical protein
MKAKVNRSLQQVITYSPLAAILGASLFNLSAFQHQVLMLLLLIWANAFFLYKSWAS